MTSLLSGLAATLLATLLMTFFTSMGNERVEGFYGRKQQKRAAIFWIMTLVGWLGFLVWRFTAISVWHATWTAALMIMFMLAFTIPFHKHMTTLRFRYCNGRKHWYGA